MCGIYGSTIYYNGQEIENKLKRIQFRGPDRSRYERINSNGSEVILGHNRLSIIDLGERSDQPLSYMNSIHIVFNGEIYNFHDLKRSLSEKGYAFHTTSDTEVICAAYLEYGTGCTAYLNGMFAFVILDTEKNLLFGSRDRLGKKPFYYYYDGKNFEFSSQLASIQLHHKTTSVSEQAISYYLAWGAVPDPYSILSEVKKLPAGHSFTFQLDSGDFSSFCYWDIDRMGNNTYKGTYGDAKEELEDILKDAVKIRLFADVPVGVFLSGGIDSSIVAAMATKVTTSAIKTFSVKFDHHKYDESHHAALVAQHLNTEHHTIECDYNEGLNLIQNYSHFYDEPFADASAIPSMLLSKYTRQHVTVALSGDGGDESFLGYLRYNVINKKAFFNIPYPLRKILSGLLRIPNSYKLNVMSKGALIKDLDEYYLRTMVNVDDSWLDNKYDYYDLGDRKYLEHKHKGYLERISDFDIKTYLNNDINTKVDRASMAFSLEARAPLMDYRIVEFARAIPTDFKFVKGNQKRILKDILYDHVPREIMERPKKGFGVPLAEWFRNELKEYVHDTLNADSLKEIPGIVPEKISFMIEQHMNGQWNRAPIIWKLFVLKQWLNNNAQGLSIH